MLLAVDTDVERGNVNNLLSDADVSLLDEHASVMDGLGQSHFENNSLEPSVEESLGGQGKNVIELLLGFVDESEPVQFAFWIFRLNDF